MYTFCDYFFWIEGVYIINGKLLPVSKAGFRFYKSSPADTFGPSTDVNIQYLKQVLAQKTCDMNIQGYNYKGKENKKIF